MNDIIKTVFASLVIMLILNSCSIEKRVYRPGYHVEWYKSSKYLAKYQQQIAKDEVSKSEVSNNVKGNDFEPAVVPVANVAVSNKSVIVFLDENIVDKIRVEKIVDGECDIIILTDGQEIEAKVLEVGIDEIKYKNCNNLDGPTFIKRKSEVFMIKYPDGTKTVIGNEPRAQEQQEDSNDEEIDYFETIDSDDKSFPVAIGLWFFLGIIGIHRFYLGHIGIGILYLLTGGLCGIGWIVDGILFLIGSLEPKNGVYLDK